MRCLAVRSGTSARRPSSQTGAGQRTRRVVELDRMVVRSGTEGAEPQRHEERIGDRPRGYGGIERGIHACPIVCRRLQVREVARTPQPSRLRQGSARDLLGRNLRCLHQATAANMAKWRAVEPSVTAPRVSESPVSPDDTRAPGTEPVALARPATSQSIRLSR